MPPPTLDLRTAPAASVVRFWSPLAKMSLTGGLLMLPFDRIAASLADPYSRALLAAMLEADTPDDVRRVAAMEGAALAEDFARRQALTLEAARVLAARGTAAEFAERALALAGLDAGEVVARATTVDEPDLRMAVSLADFASALARCCDLARAQGLLAVEGPGKRSDDPLVRFAFMLSSFGIDEPDELAMIDGRARALSDALAVKTRMVAGYAEGIRFREAPYTLHWRALSLLPEDVEDDGMIGWNAEWGQEEDADG